MSDRKIMFNKTEKAFILQCIKVYKSLPALCDIKSKDYCNEKMMLTILINKLQYNFN